MQDLILKNKPLIEAIFELRWQLEEKTEGLLLDPHYKLIIGRFFDRVKDEYPFHTQLPAASAPDEFAAYVVQHQFRKVEGGWPLMQLGPGVITLNDTDSYAWSDFKQRVDKILTVLFDVYPNSVQALKPTSLLLRYIDAVDFDFTFDSIFAFLRHKLKTSIEFRDHLFDSTGVSEMPIFIDLRFTFPCSTPKGVAHLRFTRGTRTDRNALIWETQVQSLGVDAPTTPEAIKLWVEHAHDLTHDWFLKMIEGDLRREFE